MKFARASGVLLHPTSFPSRYGIGDLGHDAYKFVDFLAETDQTLWQVMPLGPTGYGDSPYASFSAFAGNPLLISPDLLARDGYLPPEDLADVPDFPGHQVDFGLVIEYKKNLLARAFAHFEEKEATDHQAAFEAFTSAQKEWLDDYALFMALKDFHGGAIWNSWEKGLAQHEPRVLAQWRRKLAKEVRYYQFQQFQFFRQWSSLRQYANERNIKIIGDIPIFVALDSADVWSHPDLFYLDEESNPTVVAGVPPDYFSATGQRWGNPLYRWDVMAKNNYRWWLSRFRKTFEQVDIVRIDHFRGFEAYWEVPANEETAINGRWVKAPGRQLFATLKRQLGDLPIIAEDLGLITPEVTALREEFHFPGMKVLQFAFGDDHTNAYLPHNYEVNSVVYTGSHDNNTTRGWWYDISDKERVAVQLYLARDGSDVSWDLIRLAFSSVAAMAIIPLQDILDLGAEARMNTPGRPQGNWSWRYWLDALNDAIKDRLNTITRLYSRNPLEVARLVEQKEAELRKALEQQPA